MMPSRYVSLLALVLLCLPVSSSAQDTATKLDITQLTRLFEQQLLDPEDAYTKELIANERGDIRNLIEDELSTTYSPVYDEEVLDTEEELTKAVDRQRAVITALDERRRDRKVDLDLLITEEKLYYTDPPAASGALANKFRLTKTYPELLAKKAVLEERIIVLESLLNLQNARLEQIISDQRLQHFGVFITIGTYVLIVLVILYLEKLIRRHILTRISSLDRRYSVTKTFTSIVYSLLLLWIIGVIFNKQPQLLSSLAIVGAGVAIALQDVIKDVVGWFVIIHHKLFNRGNRITVGDITGEVVDFGLLRTILLEIGVPSRDAAAVLERTGKVLSVPNATFLTTPMTNHTTSSDFIRAEMHITITFESDWRKAQEICQTIIDETTNEYVERDQRQTGYRMQMLYLARRTSGNQVYLDIAADGVELIMRFTVPIGERRPTVSLLSDKILEAIGNEKDIELAYATQRILAEMSGTQPPHDPKATS